MTTDYRDTPTEKRVADLRSQPDLGYDTATERAQELEFLEEYLKWKADGGREKLEARLEAQRQANLRGKARKT